MKEKSQKPLRSQIQYIADSVNRTKTMRELGIPVSTFYRYARAYGIPYVRIGSPYTLTTEDDALIQKLSKSGVSQRAIASKFNVSRRAIQHRLYRASRGVAPRPAESEYNND